MLESGDPLTLATSRTWGRGHRRWTKRYHGSRRDPISLAVGETYGKRPGKVQFNPEGVEFDPCGVVQKFKARLFVRRFHLRLMIFMPFGHGDAATAALNLPPIGAGGEGVPFQITPLPLFRNRIRRRLVSKSELKPWIASSLPMVQAKNQY